MASGSRVVLAGVMIISMGHPPRSASAGQDASVYVDVLSSWRKATPVGLSECALKLEREVLDALAKRHVAVIGRGRREVGVSLEARVADVWMVQKSSTTPYVGVVVEHSKGRSHIYYPALAEPLAKSARASSPDEMRHASQVLTAAAKAEGSKRLARLMAERLGRSTESAPLDMTAIEGDFLLDKTPGPTVVVTIVLGESEKTCAALTEGPASRIADGIGEFVEKPGPGRSE
jgi:hypothetical protein